MSGYVNELEYDSTTQYSGIDALYIQSILPVDGGAEEDLTKRSTTATVYQLSNNGSWYAGATYTQYLGGGGQVLTILTDNAAQTQWFTTWATVYNSSHAASGGTQNDSESTLIGKDGYTYVYDDDSSGNTVASAKYVTATGAYVSSDNWAPGEKDDPYADPGNTIAPTVGKAYELTYEDVPVNDVTNSNALHSMSTPIVDLSEITTADMLAGFGTAAKILGTSSTSTGTSSASLEQRLQVVPSSAVQPGTDVKHVNALTGTRSILRHDGMAAISVHGLVHNL